MALAAAMLVGAGTLGGPSRAVVALGAAGTVLAGIGGLGGLVEAASLTFLLTFAGVNVIAAVQLQADRAVAVLGASRCRSAGVIAAARIAGRNALLLFALVSLVADVFAPGPVLRRHRRTA